MNDVSLVLAVDIGNTRVHTGIVDTVACTCHNANACPVETVSREIDRVLALQDSGLQPATAVVSGVVGHVVTAVLSRLRAAGLSVRHFSSTSRLPFDIRYENRAALGADRCANALYAYTLYPQKNVIVVSAGSAVVVDVVAARSFLGGALFPGLQLQSRALKEFTDALPLVAITPQSSAELPGTSTTSCITAGILHGAAGAVAHIVKEYTAFLKGDPPVLLATGGDWPLIAPLTGMQFTAQPHMTLVGTALFERCPVESL